MPTVLVGDATRQWAHNLDDLRQRWNIRREEPRENNWMPVDGFLDDLPAVPDAGLLDIKAELMRVQHSVNDRIRQAQASARKRNQYLDPDAWVELQSARAAIGRHLTIVLDTLGQRRREYHRQNQASFNERFIQLARERLPRPEFEALVAEATDRSISRLPSGSLDGDT